MFTFSVELALADEPYEVIGSSLKFGSNYTCLLDKAPRFAVQSYDKSAIIVSETGYVLRQDLINCQAGHAVHVFSIPSNVGVLSDINILKNIYVALDFISTQPVAYLATVARVGSSRNLVSINGAYLAGKRIGDLRKSAFGSSGEAGASIISPDGRFVAPDGHIDCTEDAYPGVWDIQKNRRVKTTDDACVAFFK
ncbi:MAG TPA: hypothetical protein VGN31_20470 [Paraburkholderia sp.]